MLMSNIISATSAAPGSCQSSVVLTESEALISSHVTDETGCGSTRSPWVIAAMPGQTIELSIIDFGSELYKRQINDSTSLPVYGYLVDGDTRISFTGDVQRNRLLHSSKSSEIQVEILTSETERQHGFLIQYKSRFIRIFNLCLDILRFIIQFLCHIILYRIWIVIMEYKERNVIFSCYKLKLHFRDETIL